MMGKSGEVLHSSENSRDSTLLLLSAFMALVRDIPLPSEEDYQAMADKLEAQRPQVPGLSDEGLDFVIRLLRGEKIELGEEDESQQSGFDCGED